MLQNNSLFDSYDSRTDCTMFYLDENVDQRIVAPLREKGIAVIRSEEEDMKGEKDDRLQLMRATELGCVLVTADDDFGRISQEINDQWPEAQHAGIVFISNPRSPGDLIAALEKIHKEWTPERIRNLFLPI
jgi:Domain of unknown function (DUF5615)